MLPPVSAVFLVARVLGLLMLVVVLALMLALWMAQRRGWQRMSAWPVGLRRVLAWLTLAGLLMLLLSLWLGEMGRLPYFVHGTITFAEVGNNLPVAGLVASLAAYVLVLGLGVWGFARMLFQAARHGVVPVRRAGETLR
ncbi:cytochrome ubiquinol oxidase subunit I [Kerstersia gyiorum]